MADHPAPSPATLRDLIESFADGRERTAIRTVKGETSRTISFADLSERSLRLAGALLGTGIGPGDPVLLIGPSSIDWVLVRFALASAGALAVALDDLTTTAELERLVPDCGAIHAFASTAHIGPLRAAPGGDQLRIWRLDEETTGPEAPHWTALLDGPISPLPTLDPHAPQMQVYTSGTTGTPKSFLLSHANLLHNIRALRDQSVIGPDDRVLMPLPLHHVYPLTVGVFSVLACRSTLVFPEAVAGPQIVKALQVGQVTAMIAAPRLYAAILSGLEARVAARGALAKTLFKTLFALSLTVRKRSGLRIGKTLFSALHKQLAPDLWLLASGGARFEATLIWKLEALGWDVRSGWGLAETASILTNNGGGPDKRIGTEGRVLTGMALRVFAPDETGMGELQARGPALFQGYRNNPEATAAAFTEDGWFRTGDLGFIDADGFVTIAGRVKEMIVLGGGKNVFPEELEKHYGATPFFKEMAVLESDGALVALVVPDLDTIAAQGSANADDVVRVTLTEKAQALPSFQRVTGYAMTRDALPRTMLGKYRRFLLGDLYRKAKAGVREQADTPLSEADRALIGTPLGRDLLAWLQARYPNHRVRPDTALQLDLGIDSLEWVTITLAVSEQFGVHFTEEDGASVTTVRDLLTLAPERAGDAAQAAAGRLAADTSAQLSGDQRAWLTPPRPAHRAVGAFLFGINQLIMKGGFRLTVTGLEHIPNDGPFIIACNHVSDLDAQAVVAAIGWRRMQRVWWAGDQDRLFGTPAGRFLARVAHIFPATERSPATTIAAARAVLRRGDILIWFPEAWRSPTGELQRFMPGIGHLVLAENATVLPGRILGTFEALPRTRKLPRLHPIRVTFGPPLRPADLKDDDNPQAVADAVRTAVSRLP